MAKLRDFIYLLRYPKANNKMDINHGPKRWRYSIEVMKALTISA